MLATVAAGRVCSRSCRATAANVSTCPAPRPTPAAPAIQWTCHGGPNQQWRLEPAGGGAFRIFARHSGQALDVFGALLDDVTPIIQYPVHGGDNQAWTLEPASEGYVRIVARHSGKAMDVEYASADDGARVIQYTPHGGANQQWLLRPVE